MGDNPIKSIGKGIGAATGFAIGGPLGLVGGAKVGERGGELLEKKLAPDMPAAATLPDAPTADDPAVDEAAAKQRKARGLASTILTSGAGSGGQLTTARRTLLGA